MVRWAHINAGLAVGHPKYPRECTLPSCRSHHVSPILRASQARAGSCRAKALGTLRQAVARWKAFETEPPIVFFSLDPKKRHLQWATWWVFGSSQAGLSEDPKKRHQKLRKPGELRLCRLPGRSRAGIVLTRESRRSRRYRAYVITDSRLGVHPNFPPLHRIAFDSLYWMQHPHPLISV